MTARIYYPRAVVIFTVLLENESTPRAWSAIPLSTDIDRNSARIADTAQIELDYQELGIDPRILQSVYVEIFAEDAQDPLSLPQPRVATLRFSGRVDTVEATRSGSADTITLSCRDFTGLYLDRDWRDVATETLPGPDQKGAFLAIGPTETLGAFVERIRLRVTPNIRPVEFYDTTVSARPLARRVGSTLLPVKDSATAWDVLVQVCDLFAQVPTFELDPVYGVVLRVRDASIVGRRGAFFRWGQNINALRLRRDLTKPEDNAIKVVCWNPLDGIELEAIWPPAGLAGGEKLEAEGQVRSTRSRPKRVQYNVFGGFTQSDLDRFARVMFEEGRQNRLEGMIETHEMRGLFGADLLALSHGDRVLVDFDPQLATAIEGKSRGEAIAYLSDRRRPNFLSKPVAAAVVDALERTAKLEIEFYVVSATHTWDREQGYQLRITFRDFVLGS